MHTFRKYIVGVACFAALSICLPANLSVARGKTVLENSRSAAIARLSSSVPHAAAWKIPGCVFSHKCGKTRHSPLKIFFSTLRMAFDEDWISKIIALDHAAKFIRKPLDLFSRFHAMLSEPGLSQGFRLSFSGLSPPSL